MNKKQLSEADICAKFITPAILSANWDEHMQLRREVHFTKGQIHVRGKMTVRGKSNFADYILYYKPNIPLAIVEAKDNNHAVGDGMSQALRYGEKARHGVRVRFALGDPDCAAVAQRGQEEGIGDAMAAKVNNALTLYRPLLGMEHIEIRLHEAILYNSIYRADGQLFVNEHAYGIPAAQSPVFCYRESESGGIATAYLDSFERVWMSAKSMH